MIRINPSIAAIRGNTPALRKIIEVTITPVPGVFSEMMTRISAVMRTGSRQDLEISDIVLE
jgi:hypothetical protein